MKNLKHTPGPWKENGFKVCTGDKTICRVDFDGGADAFDMANAKLIAAAPDLLEALQNLVNQIDGSSARTFINYEDAQQAIKRATNEI